MKKVILKKSRHYRAEHPWIFRSQIQEAPAAAVNGEGVAVYSAKNRLIGVGYYNAGSEIAIRLLSRSEEKIDQKFFERRMEQAKAYRAKYVTHTNAYRLIFSEADSLPGLIIDNYDGVYVLQTLTLGMSLLQETLLKALIAVCEPKAVYLRNDVASRKYENLPLEKGFAYRQSELLVPIEENGIRYLVDIEKGHKTGFYLDQRENRSIFSQFVRGERILDCFSNTGSFAITAAKNKKVRQVVGIDSSGEMNALAQKNAELNGVAEKCQFLDENVFDLLKKMDQKKERFDAVVLDPPSFVQNKHQLEKAYAGYKEINLRALKILNPGGLLVTASCSFHMGGEMLNQVVMEAAADAHKKLRLLSPGMQGLDHPVDLFIPETFYLKCHFYSVE